MCRSHAEKLHTYACCRCTNMYAGVYANFLCVHMVFIKGMLSSRSIYFKNVWRSVSDIQEGSTGPI